MFQLWTRKLSNITDSAHAYWQKMPYAPRGRYDCDHIIRLYRENWGDMYEYTMMPVGMCPPGLQMPMHR